MTRRTILLCLGFAALCAVIGVDIYFILRDGRLAGGPASSATAPLGSAMPPPASALTPRASASVAPSSVAALTSASEAAPPLFDDEEGTGDAPSASDARPPSKPAPPKHFGTVQEAAAGSCSTASIDGLSRQIIEQIRCINPHAFVPLPTRPNLNVASHVLGYLDIAARDRLVHVLDAHKTTTMTINSALRTVPQQYLVWRWASTKRCGVQLATAPGESNHEVGLALDVAEEEKWKPALEAAEFHWLGATDRVHFDFKSHAAPPRTTLDVLAFQKLWNKNHPKDRIGESGHYDPATEQRLKTAPADGFAIAPRCAGAAPQREKAASSR